MNINIQDLIDLGEIYKVFGLMALDLSSDLMVPLCVENCGKCCDITVPPAHRIEGIYAISVLLGEGTREKILSITEGWLLETHSQSPTYEGVYRGVLTEKLVDEYYAIASTRCPYMTADKKCMIYDGRGMVCRAFGVTNIPGPGPEFCPRPLGKGETAWSRGHIQNVPFNKQVMEYFSKLERDMVISGLLPSIIYKYLEPEKYDGYAHDNKIATAKLLGFPFQYTGLIFQEQREEQYKQTQAGVLRP